MRGSAAFRVGVAPGGALAPSWVRDSVSRAARSTPSLDLRFADNKSLIDATSGQSLVTFTRASSGTYVGSDGLIKTATTNEARFDHNPRTGESLGLLVEEQRTNSILHSEGFNITNWSLGANITYSENTADTTAPNGTNTADKLTANAATSVEYRSIQAQSTSAQVALSVFAKAGTHSFLQFRTTNASSGHVNFDLTSGTLAATTATGIITAFPNGWYRCVAVFPAVSITNVQFELVTSLSAIRGEVWTAAGTESLYLWGAQLEAGSFPTSYIPTTSATVTRSADVASITGANFSSWYRQDEGTVFAEFQTVIQDAANNRGVTAVDDGTNNNRVSLFIPAGNFPLGVASRVVSGGVATNPTNTGSITSSSIAKSAICYRVGTDGAAISVNGAIPAASSPASAPSGVNNLRIGTIFGTNNLGGTIRRLTYWPSRLPNSTLQEITR